MARAIIEVVGYSIRDFCKNPAYKDKLKNQHHSF